MDGTLAGMLRAKADSEIPNHLHRLKPEEAAALELLRQELIVARNLMASTLGKGNKPVTVHRPSSNGGVAYASDRSPGLISETFLNMIDRFRAASESDGSVFFISASGASAPGGIWFDLWWQRSGARQKLA
jgi:hypothetical protein